MTPRSQLVLRLSMAGRGLVPFVLSGIAAGWFFGGTSGLFGATLLALFAAAPLFAWLHARSLEIELVRSYARPVGQFFTAEVVLHNKSRLFAARDVAVFHGTRRAVDPRPSGFLTRLGARQRSELPLVLRLFDRGRERELSLVLVSSFPLGLFRCSASYEIPCDLLGLPRIGALSELGSLHGADPELLVGRRPRRAGEEEFHGVRDWREGESLRRVHWKHSARRDRLISREVRPLSLPDVRILLATSARAAGPWSRRDPSFEKAVSLAATLVHHYLRDGRTVRLGLTGSAQRWTAHRGRPGLHAALVRLAEIELAGEDPWTALSRALLESAPGTRRSTKTLCVLSGAGLAAEMPSDVLVLDVDEAHTDELFQRGALPGAQQPDAQATGGTQSARSARRARHVRARAQREARLQRSSTP